MKSIFEILRRIFDRLRRERRFLEKLDHYVEIPNLSPSIGIHKSYSLISPVLAYDGTPYLQWREEARAQLCGLLGFKSPYQREILSSQLIWAAKDSVGNYEKLLLETTDNEFFPIYRATPIGQDQPSDWVICLQGHTSGMHVSLGMDSTETFTLSGNYSGQDVGQYALKEGYGIVCIEQRALGSRVETLQTKKAPHPCFDSSVQSILIGETLLGQRILDLVSVVNYLRNRNNNYERWGAVGNSLGGTVALYAAAISDDLDYVIPSCCISDFHYSLLNLYHCADLYIPLLAKYFRMSDILGLAAPKLLIAAAGVCDPIFPILGFRKTILEAKEIYLAAGATNSLRVVVGTGGHRLYTREIFSELANCSISPTHTIS